MWQGIAASRGIPLAQVLQAVAAAPLPAPVAAGAQPLPTAGEAGSSPLLPVPLLDGLQYKDEVIACFRKSDKWLGKQRTEAAAAALKASKGGKAAGGGGAWCGG